jgi:hypothetical protein
MARFSKVRHVAYPRAVVVKKATNMDSQNELLSSSENYCGGHAKIYIPQEASPPRANHAIVLEIPRPTTIAVRASE